MHYEARLPRLQIAAHCAAPRTSLPDVSCILFLPIRLTPDVALCKTILLEAGPPRAAITMRIPRTM